MTGGGLRPKGLYLTDNNLAVGNGRESWCRDGHWIGSGGLV